MSYNSLLVSIDLYNNDNDRFFITQDNTLGENGKTTTPRAGDRAILTLFLKTLNDETDKPTSFIPLAQWFKVERVLLQFIANSKTFDEQEKRSLSTIIATTCKNHIREFPVIKLKNIITHTRELSVNQLRAVDCALMHMVCERQGFYHRILLNICNLYKYQLVLTFISQGGQIKECPPGYSIDWESCPKQSAEEFALSCRMEKHYRDAISDFRPTLEALFQEYQGQYQGQQIPPVLHLWRNFLAICEMQRISSLFVELVGHDSTVLKLPTGKEKKFFSDEIHTMLTAASKTENSFDDVGFSVETWEQRKECVTQFLKTASSLQAKYHKQLDAMNDYYENVWNAVQTNKERLVGYVSTCTSFSPKEFKDLTLTSIDFDHVLNKFTEWHSGYIEKVLDNDDAFIFESFFSFLGAPETHPFVLRLKKQFYKMIAFSKPLPTSVDPRPKVEKLVAELSNLSIKSEIVEKKEKKKKSRSRPHYHPQPEPIRKIVLNPFSFKLHPRVQDWFQQNPLALSKEPYAALPDTRKKEAKSFHSYPLVITQILLQETEAQKWHSPTTKKINDLYMRPGTIWRYGEESLIYEGYFADTFGPELYHHYFHRVSFSTLMQRYQNQTPFLEATDKKMITDDEQVSECVPLAVGHTRDFTIIKKRYTVEVDDTANKIRYTICFPEGLT